MHDRLRIPAATLLGLSFTSCVDRAKDDSGDAGSDDDPIVGAWVVTQIDDRAYPISSDEPGYSLRHGWSMAISPDLAGELTLYAVYDEMGSETGMFYRLPLTIDASKAPDYRLEVPFGLFSFDGPDEPYSAADSGNPTITSYGSTYEPTTGYDPTEGDTDADTGGSTGFVHDAPASDIPLGTPSSAAPGDPPPLILTCTLIQDDALDCQRERVADDPDGALRWRFKRPGPGEPAGV